MLIDYIDVMMLAKGIIAKMKQDIGKQQVPLVIEPGREIPASSTSGKASYLPANATYWPGSQAAKWAGRGPISTTKDFGHKWKSKKRQADELDLGFAHKAKQMQS